MNSGRKKLGILVTHPIQYYAPLYRELAKDSSIELTVYFAHRQTMEGQSGAGFNVPFEWDTPLLEGYGHRFLENRAGSPSTDTFWGCDTPEISDIIAKEEFDAFAVHGWYNHSYWQAIRACWRRGVPLMVRGDSQLPPGQGRLAQWLRHPLHRWFIPKFDAYLCVGRRAREYYLHFGADEQKCFFSPHAVDSEFFASNKLKYLSMKTELRRQWSLREDSIVFLFAGKLTGQKRPLDFCRAIQGAGRPNVEGLVVGDGPLRAECEAFVRQSGTPVRFTGFLNQTGMPKAFAAADVLCLCSEAESRGLVVNEAMACGLPALVTESCGCVPDLIEERETGGVFAKGDVDALAGWMKCIESDGKLLQKMSEGALRRIQDYSISNAANGFREALDRMVS